VTTVNNSPVGNWELEENILFFTNSSFQGTQSNLMILFSI